MKLVSTLLAGALALGTTTSLEAAPHRRPRPVPGHVVRPPPRPATRVVAHQRRPLRVMSATAFAAEAKPGAAALLAQLRTGIRITGVEALGSDAVTGSAAVLAKVAAMIGGDPRGITLHVLADHQVIVKLGRHAGAAPATSSEPAQPAASDGGDAAADDEGEDDAE